MRAAKIDANQEAVVRRYERLALRFSLWLVLARVYLICWWAIKARPFYLKLKTVLNRRLRDF
jgi:hypothetical protein